MDKVQGEGLVSVHVDTAPLPVVNAHRLHIGIRDLIRNGKCFLPIIVLFFCQFWIPRVPLWQDTENRIEPVHWVGLLTQLVCPSPRSPWWSISVTASPWSQHSNQCSICDRSSQGATLLAATTWFWRSSHPIHVANRYRGVWTSRIGWWSSAPCTMNKFGTIVLKWSYITKMRVANTLVHSENKVYFTIVKDRYVPSVPTQWGGWALESCTEKNINSIGYIPSLILWIPRRKGHKGGAKVIMY